KGWRVAITFRRDGKNADTYVRLMGVHTEAELLAKMEAEKEMQPPGPDKRKPKPEQPRDRNPDEQPGEQPKQGDEPKPDGKPQLPKTPSAELEQAVRSPVPAELKKQFEARTGYANFYFNRENLQRVWKSLTAGGNFSRATGLWTITGQQIPSESPSF